MKLMKRIAHGLAVLTFCVAYSATASANQFSHASGFICGNGPTNNRFVTGDYRSAFNILNNTNRTRHVSLVLALTFPNSPDDQAPFDASFRPGRSFELDSITLQPGQAVMIDCNELVGAAPFEIGGSPPYISGMLDIRSRRPLAVSLHQTAGPNTEPVSSVSVTNISAQRVQGDKKDY